MNYNQIFLKREFKVLGKSRSKRCKEPDALYMQEEDYSISASITSSSAFLALFAGSP